MAQDFAKKLAALEQRIKNVEKGQRYAHGGSIEDAALEVKDGAGSLRAIVGLQGDGTTAVNIVNGPPPPAPSAPVLGSVLGGVTVSWDGQFTDGAIPPLDWQRVEVHASTVDGFTPALETLKTTFETPQGGTVVVPCEEPVYVLLVARNTSGTASEPTVQAGPLGPAPVVATDLVDGIVTASKIAEGAVTINALTESLADTATQRYVDAMGDPDAWTVLTSAPGSTWEFLTGVPDARTGSTVAQATGFTVVRGTVQMAYDPDVLYRVSVRIRTTAGSVSGPDSVYAGALGIASDGTTYVNRTGADSYYTQLYPAASNTPQPAGGGWITYTGYLKGLATSGTIGTTPDPRVPGQAHTDVRFLSPLMYLNFGSGTSGSTGTMQVDAFTLEALKTGVVDGTNLVAGSVTTAALAADSVTATNILANAVTAAKINAGAVTTGKLDALAVTSDKIAANAITAGKILAGSVDATALAADAITGKTITGGTITGAMIQTAESGERITLNEAGENMILVYDTDGVTVGEFSARGVRLRGDSGALVYLDPDAAYPQLRFFNATNTSSATIGGIESSTGSSANLGIFTGTFSGSGYTDMRWRTYSGEDFWVAERIRAASTATYIGGRLYLDSTLASVGFRDATAPTSDCVMQFTANNAQLSKGRLDIQASASTNSALHVTADTAHTGNLLRLYRDTEKFAIDKDGNTTIAGSIKSGGRPVPAQGAWTSLTGVAWTTTPAISSYQSIRISTDGVRAYLDGAASTLTAYSSGSQNAFTIPAGMAPLKNHFFGLVRATSGDPRFLGCLIQSNGTITVYASTSVTTGDTWDFSDISWPLD